MRGRTPNGIQCGVRDWLGGSGGGEAVHSSRSAVLREDWAPESVGGARRIAGVAGTVEPALWRGGRVRVDGRIVVTGGRLWSLVKRRRAGEGGATATVA